VVCSGYDEKGRLGWSSGCRRKESRGEEKKTIQRGSNKEKPTTQKMAASKICYDLLIKSLAQSGRQAVVKKKGRLKVCDGEEVEKLSVVLFGRNTRVWKRRGQNKKKKKL